MGKIKLVESKGYYKLSYPSGNEEWYSKKSFTKAEARKAFYKRKREVHYYERKGQ